MVVDVKNSLVCFILELLSRVETSGKKIKYCPFSKWLSFTVCGHCERIFKFPLTLDELRIAWQGKNIDWHRERKRVIKLYHSPAGIRELTR